MGGGGCKSRLCTLYHSLNSNLSLKFSHLNFSFKNTINSSLRAKMSVSEFLRGNPQKRLWIATNLHRYALQILAMTRHCHTERTRSIHKFGFFASLKMTIHHKFKRSKQIFTHIFTTTKQKFINSKQLFTNLTRFFAQNSTHFILLIQIFAQFLLIDSLQGRLLYERTEVHHSDNRFCR